MALPPLDVRVNNQNIDLATRLIIEGMQEDAYNSMNPPAYHATNAPTGYKFDGTYTPENNGFVQGANPDTFDTLISFKPIPTRVGLVTEVTAWSSSACRLRIISPGLRELLLPAGYYFTEKPNALIRRYHSLYVGLRGLISPVANLKSLRSVTAQVVRASADLNFAAKNSIYFIGDSNTEGRYLENNIDTASFVPDDVYTFKIRNWLNSLYADCRVIDKSIGGKSSVDYENYRIGGLLDLVDEPALIFYNHGTNDKNAATYKTNLLAFINWALNKWPSTKIVVLGPIPAQGTWPNGTGSGLDGTSRETLLASIRTNAQAAVAEVNKPTRVAYINLGAAFNVSDHTQYAVITGEPDGSHIHIGAKGHQTIFEYIKTRLLTQYPSFVRF